MRFARLRLKEASRFDGRRPFVFGYINFKKRTQCIEVLARHLGQTSKRGFRTIEKIQRECNPEQVP